MLSWLLPKYSYKNIPLYNFLKLSEDQDYRYLYRFGRMLPAIPQQGEYFGDLMMEYSQKSKNHLIGDRFDTVKYIKQLENAYITINALIKTLWFKVDEETINTIEQYCANLGIKGVTIDLNEIRKIPDSNERTLVYTEELIRIEQRTKFILTLIQVRNNEISEKPSIEGVNFDDLLLYLCSYYPTTNEKVRLSRFVSMNNAIRRSQSKKEKAHGVN